MKRLGLFRHAKSDWDDMRLRDFDRGLNQRGRRGAALMGQHIRDSGGAWDQILASPARRVRLTLEASGLDLPVAFAEEAYLADSHTLLRLVRGLPEAAQSVIIAGHNPGLQDLALGLVGYFASAPANHGKLVAELVTKFPTAAFATIELDIDTWAQCDESCGRLVHFARPRDLDPGLGPEPLR